MLRDAISQRSEVARFTSWQLSRLEKDCSTASPAKGREYTTPAWRFNDTDGGARWPAAIQGEYAARPGGAIVVCIALSLISKAFFL